jgi:hypothetical protein
MPKTLTEIARELAELAHEQAALSLRVVKLAGEVAGAIQERERAAPHVEGDEYPKAPTDANPAFRDFDRARGQTP